MAGRSDSLSLDAIFLEELEQIRLRREWLKADRRIAETVPHALPDPPDANPETANSGSGGNALKISAMGQDRMALAGLALSGGGIRSAAFCLGALQAFNRCGALDRIDYLSTVSGGGYLGSALSATSYATYGAFAFDKVQGKPAEPARITDIDDSPVVSHIRNYSNFLAPHGITDWIASAALLARGLITNMFMIAPWILLCAAATLIYNPGRENLDKAGPGLLESALGESYAGQLGSSFETFAWPAGIAVLLALYMLVWSLLRSSARFGRSSEFTGVFARIGGWSLVVLAAALFLSAQNGLLGALHPPAKFELVETKAQIAFSEHLIALAQSTLLASPLIVFLVGFFGDALAKLATEEATAVSRKLAKHASKLALLAGALALPVLLWVVYLRIVSWGLQCNMAGTPCAMSLAEFPVGEGFAVYRPAAAIGLAAAILLAIMRLLKPNAYSLHRLYRDRLAKAFVIHPNREDPRLSGRPGHALCAENVAAEPEGAVAIRRSFRPRAISADEHRAQCPVFGAGQPARAQCRFLRVHPAACRQHGNRICRHEAA